MPPRRTALLRAAAPPGRRPPRPCPPQDPKRPGTWRVGGGRGGERAPGSLFTPGIALSRFRGDSRQLVPSHPPTFPLALQLLTFPSLTFTHFFLVCSCSLLISPSHLSSYTSSHSFPVFPRPEAGTGTYCHPLFRNRRVFCFGCLTIHPSKENTQTVLPFGEGRGGRWPPFLSLSSFPSSNPA